jgi:uncharacterized protein YjbI with pentapeptide repeats
MNGFCHGLWLPPHRGGKMARKPSSSSPITPDALSALIAAHRSWLESAGKEGHKANLSGADLEGLNLHGYDLSHLDFRGANLARAKFGDVPVEDTNFQAADLQEADLSGARGLLAPQLAGADLAGAKLPDSFKEFAALKHVDAASGHVQGIFSVLLLVCVYCWLTIAVTTDAGLLNNFAETALPIINTKINLVMFYWAAPFLLLSVYLYFHLCLQRLWEALAELPAVFPDGLPLPRRVHPWLWNGLVWAYSPRLRDRCPPLLLLQKILAIFLVWWAGPLTILALWWRYLPAHDWTITFLQLIFLAMALDGALGFSLLTRATLSLKERKPHGSKKMERVVHSIPLVLSTAAIAGIFFLLSLAAIDGLRQPQDGVAFLAAGQMGADRCAILSQGDGVLKRLKKLRKSDSLFKPPQDFLELCERVAYGWPCVFANLEEADVSLKLPQWKPGDLDQVRGVFLRGRNLRFAKASRVFLAKADLVGTNLQNANLREANLQYADLSGAHLQHAHLNGANLQRATLRKAELLACLDGANLQQADLSEANLEQGELRGADLRQATLKKARLRQATLYMANLQGAVLSGADLEEADLIRADLQQADLSEANLELADLFGANLQQANLSGANLSGAIGLTREQLRPAILDGSTQLPDHLKDLASSGSKRP